MKFCATPSAASSATPASPRARTGMRCPGASTRAASSRSTTARPASARSRSPACTSDAPCVAVCPVDCIYQTWSCTRRTCASAAGYCFYACPFGAPQFPLRPGNFGSRGKIDKCTYSAPAGRRRAGSATGLPKVMARNRLADGKLPLCAEMWATKAPARRAMADVIADIYRERVVLPRLRLRCLGAGGTAYQMKGGA